MKNQFHILNGDALKAQFPEVISGVKLVARECMIDGNVSGNTIDEIFQNRAMFIEETFQDTEYNNKVIAEFDRVKQIPEFSEINLWFEDDLFCQTNLWFVLFFLQTIHKNFSLYLVRPNDENKYSFGHMNAIELEVSFKNRISIDKDEIDSFAKLWTYYQHSMLDEMEKVGKSLNVKFPSLLPAIKAHINRVPDQNGLGQPQKAILEIMGDLNTTKFPIVFKEFCKREAIYGFGDVQVKRMFDELTKTK